jgi:DNA-binding FadR family transcriptional regulator
MARDITLKVIRCLRERILLGEYVECLPGERKLCSEFEASRSCIRIALERLSAEGLVLPRAGRRWRVLGATNDSTFEVVTTSVSQLSYDAFVARLSELLELRTRHFVAGVDSLVRQQLEPSAEALSALADLGIGIERYKADEVLTNEDLVMKLLLTTELSFPSQLAAHQLFRALAEFRTYLKTDFYLRYLSARFNVLFDAIKWRDRQRALLFAEDVASARNSLYLRLANERGIAVEKQTAQHIFGEN